MRSKTVISLPVGLGALFVIILFSGISPQSHRVSNGFLNAERALQVRNPVQAASQLALLASLLSWRSDLWEQAGQYALQGGDSQAAIRYLEKVTLTQQGQVALVSAYQLSGDPDSAARMLEKVLLTAPSDSELYAQLLALHRETGNLEAAVHDLETLAAMEPGQAEWAYQLGLLLACQQPELALAPLQRAVQLDPTLNPTVTMLSQRINKALLFQDPAYSLLEAGRALSSIAQWPLAAAAFRQSIAMRPDFADSWAYLGEALQHIPSGQALPAQPKDDALQALEKALSLAPASVSANSFLALYYQRQDAPGQAFPYLQTAIRSDSDNPTLLAMLGAILASQGDLPGALAAYQKAIGLAPREPIFMKLLALFTIKYKYQPAETGLPAASEAVQLNPKDVEGLDILGQVFLQLNDPENAELTLRRAIQLDPAYAPVYLHLGMAAYQVGDYAGAAANLEQAQSLAPGSPIADQAQRLLEIYLP